MVTTELHLVLRLRERVELYFFPSHARTTFTVPFVSHLFGAGVFLTFIEPKSYYHVHRRPLLVHCPQPTVFCR